jgi:glycosyltransferase involved in cell wall biosynthesis
MNSSCLRHSDSRMERNERRAGRTLLTIAPRHFLYDERVLRTIESARGFGRSFYAIDREMFDQLGTEGDAVREAIARRLDWVEFVLLPSWKQVRVLARFTRGVYALQIGLQAKSLAPDVVHIHESGSLGLLIAAWVRRFIPTCTIIFDYHDWIPSEIAQKIRGVGVLYRPAMRLFMPWMRRLARSVDVAVCISPGQAEWTRSELGIPEAIVIQNVRPRRTVKAELALPFRPQLMFAGNIMRIRRLEFLIAVVADLHARGVPATLDICGDFTEPDYVRELKARAQSYGLQDNVSFHGRYGGDDELVGVASRGALGVVLGLVEAVDTRVNRIASGNKLFSYLALGVPVLVERCYENMRDIAEGAGAGLAFESVGQCADVAQRIWSDSEMWQRMHEGALRVSETMNADSYRSELEKLYA